MYGRLSRFGGLLFIVMLSITGCNLGESASTPVPTLDIPRVEILFPANNVQVAEGFDLTIDVFAEDATNGISRIVVTVDDILLREASVQGDRPVLPQFRIETNWVASGIGRHLVTAIAYRLDGTQSDEATIVIEVVPNTGAEETPES